MFSWLKLHVHILTIHAALNCSNLPMIFILTNDDGIDAPGIAAMKTALGDRPSLTVAPDRPLSGCSHQLNRGGPIAIDGRGDSRYAVGGTPADCTRVALSYLHPDATPTSAVKETYVLSGINAGGNMGADIYVSGTVAAVREATLMRVPGIAISQYIFQQQPIDWERTIKLSAQVIDKLLSLPHPPGTFWNVNLPFPQPGGSEPKMVFCNCCTQPLPTQFAVENSQFRYVGRYGDRQRDPGGDVDVCLSGNISVTQIRLW
ncbi:MAG: 5'/3'-nucleotidase SurE [Cyanobacteria bacterium P01_D01_bin.128]